MENKRILVVDDDTEILKSVKEILETKKYLVDTAESGKKALEKFPANSYSLVLLDIKLPDMSGIELLEKIHALNPEVTKIMVTGYATVSNTVDALNKGASAYILKPMEPQKLLEIVAEKLKGQEQASIKKEFEKKKFESVIQNLIIGAVVCSSDWQVISSNNSARKYLGNNLENINFLDFIFSNFSVSLTKKEINDKTSRHRSFDIVRAETEKTNPLFLEVSLDWLVLTGAFQEFSAAIMTLRDVTESRMEAALKEEFLGLISHKLRTPITIINSNLYMLEDSIYGELNEDQKKSIAVILKKSHYLSDLIERLLTFTTVTNKNLNLSGEPVNLEEYLPALIEKIVKKRPDRKILPKINFLAKKPILKINPDYFNLIMENLVDNAVKFNSKESLEIEIEVNRSSGFVEISVRDNGPGIPPEETDRVFEKFYQVEKHFTGNVEGLGLGLALVKKLVEAYGGAIKIKSKIAEGTTIAFTLPEAI